MNTDGNDHSGLPRVSGHGSAEPSRGRRIAKISKVTFDGKLILPASQNFKQSVIKASHETPQPDYASQLVEGGIACEEPESSAIKVDEAPGCSETIVGIAVLFSLVFVGWVIWSIFSIGRPASFLCVLCLLLAGIFYLIAKRMKEGDAKRKRLSIRIATGLVGDASRAALWTSVGLAVVWLFQLLMHLLPNVLGTEQALDLQLGAYDLADSLKSAVTPLRFLITIGAAIGISILAGAIWPINVIGTAKKWISTFAAILITFSSMTFVAVQAGSDRYNELGIEPIRAKIGEDLNRLRQARREHAALQWIGATVHQQVETSPEDARSWQRYLGLAAERCEAAEQRFERGYASYERVTMFDRPSYCTTREYAAELVERQFHQREAATVGTAEPAMWIPEFRNLGITAVSPDTEFEMLEVARVPRRLEELKAFAKRVNKAAADQERARDRIESAVTSVVASMIGEAGSGVADEVLAKMKETVLKAIARDTRERVALWLRMKDVPLPRAVETILNIEPELKLESPRRAMEAAGGAENFVQQTWYGDHHATVSLEQLGRAAAIAHGEEVQRQIDEAERQREQARESAREYARDYARRPGGARR